MIRRNLTAIAFFILLAGMIGLVHVRYDRESGHMVSDGTLTAFRGDEPPYIAMVNSLLFDHDLELGTDYRRARRGGFQLGVRHRHEALQHHTIVVDRTTNEHELWVLVYGAKGQPVCPGCADFGRRIEGFPAHHDLLEVPAHPIAFPVIVAAAIAAFRPTIETTERDVGLLVVTVSWLTVVLTYLLALRTFRARGPAMGAALLLLLCSPWLAYSRSYFSEPMIGLFVVAASLAMARRKIVLAAIALSIAIAIKAPFVLVAAAFVLDCAWKKRWRDALVLSAIVGALGLGLAALNFHLARTPLIVGAGGSPSFGGFGAMFDTLFARDYGLVCFVPWVPFAFLGVAESLRRRPWLRRTALATLLFFLLMCVSGMGPGDCYGPRYWVPLLPWLSIEAVRFFLRAQWPARIVSGGAVAVGAAIAVSGALLYTDSFMEAANRWW